VIVADYDCDGATACAVGVRGLRMPGRARRLHRPEPFRIRLRPDAGNRRARREKSPDIIVTVDNGIASIDGVAAANARGIDVVVTDHHLPGDSCRTRA
jgi:single-stranded-DNA-specific exonuclease